MKDLFVSPTRLDAIQICWKYYELAQLRKLIPFIKAERMEKGSVGHKILYHYYRELGLNVNRVDKRHRNDIIEEAFKIGTLEATKTDLTREALNGVFENCHSYFRHYQHEDWLPLLDDKGQPLVEVPLTKVLFQREDTSELEGIRIIFNGIIDLILAARKGVPVTIVDHKFKDRISDLDPLSNQMALYSASTGIQDVLRNDIGSHKEGNPNKFHRPSFRYEQSQMNENIQWAVYWALEAEYHEAVAIFPPNPTSCDKFGGCLFRRVCNTIPAGREGVINANFRTRGKFSIYVPEPEPSPSENKVETAKELATAIPTVPGVRVASGEVGDSQQDVGNESGLEPVQVLPQDDQPREGVRDGSQQDAGGPGKNIDERSAEPQAVSDRLLSRLGE
jgi:hypothetical protein